MVQRELRLERPKEAKRGSNDAAFRCGVAPCGEVFEDGPNDRPTADLVSDTLVQWIKTSCARHLALMNPFPSKPLGPQSARSRLYHPSASPLTATLIKTAALTSHKCCFRSGFPSNSKEAFSHCRDGKIPWNLGARKLKGISFPLL